MGCFTLAVEPAFKLREDETVMVRAEHQDFNLVQTHGRPFRLGGAHGHRVRRATIE